jgi:hypothetical protein
MRRDRSLCVLTAALVIVACQPETSQLPVESPSFEVSDVAVVTVSVIGANGNICNSLAGGGSIQIFAIDMGVPLGGPTAVRNVVCPQNSFAFSLPHGTYLFRARLPAAGAVAGGFPWQSFLLTPVTVSGDLTVDLTVAPGTPLAGGATLNGQPYAGIGITFVHGDATGFGAGFGVSGANGTWEETFPQRSQLILQNGVRLQPNALCSLVGARVLEPFSFAVFEFPSERSSIACDFVDAPAQQFSHTRTRLVVTPGPGAVGVGQGELPAEFGNGWGVQFPVTPGEKPRIDGISVSELFNGGLVVGMKPDRVLSANELGGYFPCGPVCRDFGPEGRLHFNTSSRSGAKVTWQYTDANSSEGVGLKVVQKSYDGIPPADYVLLRFTLTNGGAQTQTIYPGFFGDWDIGDDFFDDVGAIEQDGRLMYMTNSSGGIAAGTLIVSDAPVSGNAFFNFDFETNTAPTSRAEFVDALAGDFGSPNGDQFGDKWLVQAVGPITLTAGASTELWIGLVAGENIDQLRANAAAAEADIVARRRHPDDVDGAPATSITVGRGKSSQPNTINTINPACKKGCRTLQ